MSITSGSFQLCWQLRAIERAAKKQESRDSRHTILKDDDDNDDDDVFFCSFRNKNRSQAPYTFRRGAGERARRPSRPRVLDYRRHHERESELSAAVAWNTPCASF